MVLLALLEPHQDKFRKGKNLSHRVLKNFKTNKCLVADILNLKILTDPVSLGPGHSSRNRVNWGCPLYLFPCQPWGAGWGQEPL